MRESYVKPVIKNAMEVSFEKIYAKKGNNGNHNGNGNGNQNGNGNGGNGNHWGWGDGGFNPGS